MEKEIKELKQKIRNLQIIVVIGFLFILAYIPYIAQSINLNTYHESDRVKTVILDIMDRNNKYLSAFLDNLRKEIEDNRKR